MVLCSVIVLATTFLLAFRRGVAGGRRVLGCSAHGERGGNACASIAYVHADRFAICATVAFRRGARGALPSALCMALAVELVNSLA